MIDDILIKLSVVKIEVSSLFLDHIRILHIIKEAPLFAQNCLILTVRNSYIPIKLSIGRLSNHPQNQCVTWIHLLSQGLQFIQILLSLNIHSNLLGKGCVVRLQHLKLNYKKNTPCFKLVRAS